MSWDDDPFDLDGDGIPEYLFFEMMEDEETRRRHRPPDSGGCYIATCVYGSYHSPEVRVLRRYRDERLARTVFGRLFIRGYYAVSPTLVRAFGDRERFRRFWRRVLDRRVARLRRRGVPDGAYADPPPAGRVDRRTAHEEERGKP